MLPTGDVGVQPQSFHIGASNENGDVEATNGAFKRAVEQHLLLRGSRNFETLEGYESFLFGIMEKRNERRRRGWMWYGHRRVYGQVG